VQEEGTQGATILGVAADAGRKLRWIVSGDTHLRRYPPRTQRLSGGRADAAKNDSHQADCHDRDGGVNRGAPDRVGRIIQKIRPSGSLSNCP
jgi:hypothetical protein